MGISINEVDKVEILTIQDNYIDIASRDSTEVVLRAIPLKDMEVKNSILAEHGFSAIVTVTKGEGSRSVLFDFGFSEKGAAFNANALGVDLKKIECTALSHGHMDHFGGMVELMKGVGKKLDLVLHPEAFRQPRYVKITENFKPFMPPLKREMIDKAGLTVKETKEPYPLVGGDIIFLGQIPRVTEYEKGMASMHYEDGWRREVGRYNRRHCPLYERQGEGACDPLGLCPLGDNQHRKLCQRDNRDK